MVDTLRAKNSAQKLKYSISYEINSESSSLVQKAKTVHTFLVFFNDFLNCNNQMFLTHFKCQ